MIKKNFLITILITIAFVTCIGQPLSEPQKDPTPMPEGYNHEISDYLDSLNYDPRQILAEQIGDSVFPAKPLPNEVDDDGNAIIICKQVKHHLSGNLDDILILNPIHSVVWPGALVKVDQELVRGMPTPLQYHRAPVKLSIDLPGIGDQGIFAVENPSNGTVQAAIDKALDYWNNNQYKEGYVSKSRSKYTSTFVYSTEQLAASLGINYWNLKGSLSTQFQMATTREKKVAVVLFKQVFYTVAFDPPSNSGAVFHPNVTVNDIKKNINNETPPAYVSSVDYGRILMLQIETSSAILQTEMEATLKYLSAQATASADYQKTLQNSKITLIAIGGNAEVNTQAIDANHIEDLHKIIQGQNALYSKNNPGQPISYTIRFLKDNRLAKMGYATDYTELVCERHPHGWIGFKHSGVYIAKFYMNWKEGDQQKSWSSGKKAVGYMDKIQLKGNAHDINIAAQVNTGFGWHNIFKLKLDGPPNKFYVVKGTTLHTKWETADK